ncbi:helix-turn-helix domain-containing protein [Enterococcus cecorum]|uniref:helix-turn-helix transcriptional regulator n=1 Tax=Enterococcus cecorum TaxID=44008 RepID=UPI001FADA4E2|nr:helix-turn-helix domain-containing protein [Enterococcus cecorum]MCJ0553134.1 helix-turn-helix domain-containing protein [Enterococcus cecorum]MCJ0558597.1 helix-turn-helix domain-containing protein [Enterococcus cecorum]MCJ0563298.1 helix-turn-helix domain-containing protein [Enterococcus cecorum]
MYLNVKEIAEKLGNNGMTSNQEVIRRWIRQGKFESSIKLSNKQGWLVDSAEIERLIADRQATSKSNKKALENAYKQGYSDGQEQERQAYHAKIRDILYFGYQTQGKVLRADFYQLTELPSAKFKAYCDKNAFGKGVSKPRKALDYLQADGIFYFLHFGVIDSWEEQYQEIIDEQMAEEENARRILEKKLYLNFLAENKG